jgi:riboflavin synthase
MFTGLVEQVGHLISRRNQDGGARLRIACSLGPLALGESVAANGVCLTVADAGAGANLAGPQRLKPQAMRGWFDADASSETLDRSTLGRLLPGAAINLERAMLAGGRFGGHMVAGHVDGVGELMAIRPLGNASEWTLRMPPDLARFVASKGSITIDGISLTVNAVTLSTFAVAIIPHTLESTALATAAPGMLVNLEVDMVARYLARLLEVPAHNALASGAPDSLWGALEKSGYR